MGTRADFYVGRGEDAEWLGSIAWDGYPDGIDPAVLSATTEASYREQVSSFLGREDGTLPEMGWPWPWDDSCTTDYAYAFDSERVYASSFGHAWFVVTGDEVEVDDGLGKPSFPNMAARRNMPALSDSIRSGVIVISSPGARP